MQYLRTSIFIQAISTAPLQVHYYSEALPTQYGYCVGVSQVTTSEGLAQGLYLAARTGYEPATIRTKGAESTNEPPRPTYYVISLSYHNFYHNFLSVTSKKLREY